MATPDCEQIASKVFRPMFDLEMNVERLESLISRAHQLSAEDLPRRQNRDLTCLDWQKDGVRYTTGLQNERLLFISMHYEPGQLTARQVIACLGAPMRYQAWSDAWQESQMSSAMIALVYPTQQSIVHCAQYYSFVAEQAPAIDDGMPVTMISVFGTHWEANEPVLGRSRPWPGDWKDLEIEFTLHHASPVSDRDQAADALPITAIPEVLAEIQRVFADAPRPGDDELLHPGSYDDNDIQALIGVPHWRELPDASVESEYSALAFLGPAGFRHFLPAYLSWVLRHPESGAAVVGSTTFSLAPAGEEPQRSFMLSKFSLLDAAQRAAVVSFLRVMANFDDVRTALDYWYPH